MFGDLKRVMVVSQPPPAVISVPALSFRWGADDVLMVEALATADGSRTESTKSTVVGNVYFRDCGKAG